MNLLNGYNEIAGGLERIYCRPLVSILGYGVNVMDAKKWGEGALVKILGAYN